jgi:DNA-binding response OmpR family regulator
VNEPQIILATDDEMGVLSLYRSILERAGFHVIDTIDSVEALDICHRERIALVISDIIKPHMDGLEMIAHLRADPDTTHIPILVVSARGDSAEAAFQMGADSFIHKPFHPSELLNEIQRLLYSAAVG